jgi:hypothetical protein
MLNQLHDNKTIDLFIDVKLLKDNNIYFSLYRKSESFLLNFAAVLFNSMFATNLTCKDVSGNNITPRPSTYSQGSFEFRRGEGNTYIVISNSTTDQTLTLTDHKLNAVIPNRTVVSGFPQYVVESGTNHVSYKVTEKWAYVGSDTIITASALYYSGVIDTTLNYRQVMLAKDVFNPEIELQSNSLIEWSYIIKISL